ncbi:hypothetical protein BS47DRAFT_1394231 [Hydnum rufescens UP504]|uniref:Uncharacterized protein n=1 Tax=Hydnum rufescens UP504 TaxID=1448309 RepID=A0A9P6AX98_9AGAM|nr:hypothetical protein BS47DRAFT_1394231 [Hydnum rufescens UP504]
MPAPSPALSMISMGPKTNEDPVFVSLIKKEENKTSEGFWPDSVNTSGAIVKQYNNDESSKVDQLYCSNASPYIAKYRPIKSKREGRERQAIHNPDSTATLRNLRLLHRTIHQIDPLIVPPLLFPSTSPSRTTKLPQAPNQYSMAAATHTEHGPLITKQSLIDEWNAAQKLEEVRKKYEIQRSEDIKHHVDLLDQLSRMIVNHNLQMDSLMPPLSLLSATLHQREADLNTKSDVLNKRDLKLLRDEYYVSAWRDRLLYPSTYLHTSQNIVWVHPTLPLFFIDTLHPSLSAIGLTFHLARHGPTIVTDDCASTYYMVRIRDIQYDLQNNEWDKFKDTTTEFELKELPSNPGIEIVSDDDSSGW